MYAQTYDGDALVNAAATLHTILRSRQRSAKLPHSPSSTRHDSTAPSTDIVLAAAIPDYHRAGLADAAAAPDDAIGRRPPIRSRETLTQLASDGTAVSESSSLGKHLALAIGIAGLSGAGLVVALGGDRIFAVILVLVGASAFAGWAKARRPAD
jgi:hypothetical protein